MMNMTSTGVLMTKHDIPAGVSRSPASFDKLRTGSFDGLRAGSFGKLRTGSFDTRLTPLLRVRKEGGWRPFDTLLAPLLRVRKSRASAAASLLILSSDRVSGRVSKGFVRPGLRR